MRNLRNLRLIVSFTGSLFIGSHVSLYAQAGLRLPENLSESVEYREDDHTYIQGTTLNNSYLEVPMLMTPEEYTRWKMEQSMHSFFREKNSEAFRNSGADKFDFTDMRFDLGPAEKIFGPGGVQIKTRGSAAIKLGVTHNTIENPSLPVQNRKTTGFDFDEQINLNVNARVGDKIDMDLNYNSEATFDFDAKKIKLRYEGKEDEIIRLLEAGNVQFPTNSSLIQGASSLFGIRTDLQFGKLKLQAVLSQKKSSSTTINTSGGEQITTFEIDASDYDENRHFFLSHFFRDNFDKNMSMLPAVVSGIYINRIEVWITNKRSSYESPRNIVAFTDLGEQIHISNPTWVPKTGPMPSNEANSLYYTLNTEHPSARHIESVQNELETFMSGSRDFKKLSNARKLNENEYTLNSTLGYISLKNALSADEVLAVSYKYTYNGQSYQVGEFSQDITDVDKVLYVKLLKSNFNSPGTGTWDLMMKNVYSLSSGTLSQKGFKLGIYYSSDSTGSNLPYLPEADMRDRILLQVMALDRLDDNQSAHPNGAFDYVEGYTVIPSTGRIVFPVVEPFGSHLKTELQNSTLAEKYLFQELYDSTKVVAKRVAEKDKFKLIGEYSGSSNSVIQLGSFNIPAGSVKVTAGGATLTENSDYIVDYSMGTVTIINQSIIDAGTSVSVQLESNTEFSMQRKTMLGMNWEYDFSKNLVVGGTVMHLNERPLTSKVALGDEPLVNTMYGFNMSWKHESQGLTNLVDLIPFVHATEPSTIQFNAEMAKLISKVSDKVQGNASYIDDFEAAESGIDLRTPSAWSLSSVPMEMKGSNYANDIRSGFYRSLINWFYIDPLFTRRNSSLTPAHIKSDLDQLSNHYVREIYERELFPNKESVSSESTTLQVFNLAYYPEERGPYNLNPDLNPEGRFSNPHLNWGGIMRALNTTNFEAANIEYIEFWMLDPFIYNPAAQGGDMYINLGEISEDILRDGKKFFENGMPTGGAGNLGAAVNSTWGKMPTTSSLVYAFDNNSANSRQYQDVGLNGLSSDEERSFPTYRDYLNEIKEKVNADKYPLFESDPAADNFHHFRGSDYDEVSLPVLDRYKLYNGTEGNSPSASQVSSRFDTSSRTTPDVEDINTDFTLDESNDYFSYRISMRPSDLRVGYNYISDKREVKVKLRNGNTETVNWYCFRIPVDSYESVTGSIRDFTSIRFMRIYLTNFREETHLRFGTLQLMTSQWRTYEQPIYSSTNSNPTISGQLTASSVNIEENGDRVPVNYVMPPGITRILDPNQTQLVQDNEQAMSLTVSNLSAGEARAIYKKSGLDLRRYQQIQMFAHAESLIGADAEIEDGDISVFIRLGSDFNGNYYEYEIPLQVTPAGMYSKESESDRAVVWPKKNMLDINLSTLTTAKNHRNEERNRLGSAYTQTIYSEYDPANPDNKISIAGNPTIGNVRAIMIGVRNNSLSTKSAEVWVNELRLAGYESRGGMAARGGLNMQLSDIGSLAATGQMSTAGYGGLEQNIGDRSVDNIYKYSVTTSFDLGRFLPEKAQVTLPIYYSYTKEETSPQYSPYDTDLKLDDVLDTYSSSYSRDSVRQISTNVVASKNFSITGAKVNISSKKPMPYDPSNFTFSYSSSLQERSGSTIEYEHTLNWKLGLNYSYTNNFKGLKPFFFIHKYSVWLNLFKETSINLIPKNITFNTELLRNYHELQDRNLDRYSTARPVIFSQQFNWNRNLSLRWDLFTSLHLDLTARTNAEIEEPYTVVNKSLYPDEYEVWKDSVKMSLARMGNPLTYQQTMNATWQVPITKLPILNWIKLDATLNTTYGWNRGMRYTGGVSYGNTITNRREMGLNGNFNFQNLYNKVKWLKEVNDLYYNASGKKFNNAPPKKGTRYQKEHTLLPDSTFVITHNQNTLRPTVTLTKKDGTAVKLKVRSIDSNTISIKSKDTVTVLVHVIQDPKHINRTERLNFDDVAKFTARTLMMLRSAQITYKNTYSLSLPGFMPGSKLFGQSSSGGVLSPGLGFAFGLTDDSYLKRASSHDWLLNSDSVTYSAASASMESLQARMVLEPFAKFKIDINSSWNRTDTRTIQFMYAGMPQNATGNFSMTVISMRGAFEKCNADNSYASKSFDKFIEKIYEVQAGLQKRYEGSLYPDGSMFAGESFDPAIGGLNLYSADVLIPAFLSTYTGKSLSGSYNLFPGILSMMPNWTLSYNGLVDIPEVAKYFKSVTLTHGYKSTYSMGSFNTYNNYMENSDGLGFITDVASGNPIPSSIYSIGSVSINESFAPLVGLNATLHNGLTTKIEMRKSRQLNLSTTSVQLVETRSDDIVVGVGYKIAKLTLLGAKAGTGKNKVSNDLNINADFSFRSQNAICRNIKNLTTQATSGNRAIKGSFTADYTYSKMLTLNFYYDFQSNFPLVSTSAYPTTAHDCGITFKFSLTH